MTVQYLVKPPSKSGFWYIVLFQHKIHKLKSEKRLFIVVKSLKVTILLYFIHQIDFYDNKTVLLSNQ